MSIDVRFLRDFYNTALGQRTAQDLLRVLGAMDLPAGKKRLCLGYGLPLFSAFGDGDRGMVWAMPARQGIMPWPVGDAVRAVLVEDHRLPFANETFDTVLAIHSLELTHDPEGFLQDILRVAVRGAPIVLIVPNRLGLWAHRDQTPFGYGHPYTLFQLTELLRRCCLKITMKKPVLSFWPYTPRWANHPLWSRLWPQALAGAWCVRIEREAVWAVVNPKPVFVPARRAPLVAMPQPSGYGPLPRCDTKEP
jgi:SAM-dependent methyltransferase